MLYLSEEIITDRHNLAPDAQVVLSFSFMGLQKRGQSSGQGHMLHAEDPRFHICHLQVLEPTLIGCMSEQELRDKSEKVADRKQGGFLGPTILLPIRFVTCLLQAGLYSFPG